MSRLLRTCDESHENGVHQHLLSTYVELRRMAGAMMQGERRNHTLQPTALVHEAIVRIMRRESTTFNDSTHFFHTTVREMRRVLIDWARKSDSAAWKHLSRYLSNGHGAAPLVDRLDVLAIDEAIESLGRLDREQSEIAQFRLFSGLRNTEIARILSISERTVERKWTVARNRIAVAVDVDRVTRGRSPDVRT